MTDWAKWIVDSVGGDNRYILDECIKGPVNSFQKNWPGVMQHRLNPKSVAKGRGAKSHKTLDGIYQVFLLGLMLRFRSMGWEVNIEERAGEGYVDIRLVSKTEELAVLIELKSRAKLKDSRRMPKRRSSKSKRRTIEMLKAFRVCAFFENMVLLGINFGHMLKVDLWSSSFLHPTMSVIWERQGICELWSPSLVR